jgi:hypothetical protein
MTDDANEAPRLMEDIMRENTARLCDAYVAYTGMTQTMAARTLFGDATYLFNVLGKRKRATDPAVSFRVRSYDVIVARFSECWPVGVEWPAGISRVRPEQVPAMPTFPPPHLPEQSADEVAQRAEAQVRTARELERVAQITAARQQVPAISPSEGAAA